MLYFWNFSFRSVCRAAGALLVFNCQISTVKVINFTSLVLVVGVGGVPLGGDRGGIGVVQELFVLVQEFLV